MSDISFDRKLKNERALCGDETCFTQAFINTKRLDRIFETCAELYARGVSSDPITLIELAARMQEKR